MGTWIQAQKGSPAPQRCPAWRKGEVGPSSLRGKGSSRRVPPTRRLSLGQEGQFTLPVSQEKHELRTAGLSGWRGLQHPASSPTVHGEHIWTQAAVLPTAAPRTVWGVATATVGRDPEHVTLGKTRVTGHTIISAFEEQRQGHPNGPQDQETSKVSQ